MFNATAAMNNVDVVQVRSAYTAPRRRRFVPAYNNVRQNTPPVNSTRSSQSAGVAVTPPVNHGRRLGI